MIIKYVKNLHCFYTVYGKLDTVQGLVDVWDRFPFPDEFVLLTVPVQGSQPPGSSKARTECLVNL